MKNRKRILAWLLVICMTVTLLPVVALADADADGSTTKDAGTTDTADGTTNSTESKTTGSSADDTDSTTDSGTDDTTDATEAEDDDGLSGSCGDSLTWTLTENSDSLYYTVDDGGNIDFSLTDRSGTKVTAYTLTISGSGDMADYARNTTPWGLAIQTACDEDNPDGISSDTTTNIVSKFYSPRITQIVWADDIAIAYIGSHAFRSTSITSFTIPASVEAIGDYALIQCQQLESITEESSTANRDFYVNDDIIYETYETEDGTNGVALRFFPLAKFTRSYRISSDVTAIGSNALQYAQFTSVTIPDSVRSIDSYAFCGTDITSITLPDEVEFGTEFETADDAGAGVFSGCTSLTTVENFPSVETIPTSMFESCVSLTSFEIPDGVTTIGNNAFRDTGLTEIAIPTSVETIGTCVFAGHSSDDPLDFAITVTFENVSSLQSIGKNCFIYRPSYSIVFETGSESAYYVCRAAGYTASLGGVEAELDGVFTYNLIVDSDGEVYIEITGFADTATDDNKYNLVIPDEIEGYPVTSIADYAFNSACADGKIYTVTIGANVESIGEQAFSCISGGSPSSSAVLKSVTFVDGADVEIGYRAFQKSLTLTTFDAGDRVISLGNDVFLDSSALTTVNIPNVTSLGYGVFYNTKLSVLVINGEAEYDKMTFYQSPSGATVTTSSLASTSATIYVTGSADAVASEVADLATVGSNIVCLLDGGSVDIDESADSTTSLIAPTRAGYIFQNWTYTSTSSSDDSSTESTTTSTLSAAASANTVYTATWTECSHTGSTLVYTASGDTISETCSLCAYVFGTATISAPSDLTYDGTAKEATVTISSGWSAGTPTITYYSGNTVLASAPTAVGTYTASITVSGVTASVEFTISEKSSSSGSSSSGSSSSSSSKSSSSSSSSSSSTKKYSIDVDDDDIENGTVEVSKSSAKKGATVTITVTPDDGYELEELLVLDEDGDEIDVTDNGNGTYTFTMPKGEVTITATFVEIEDEDGDDEDAEDEDASEDEAEETGILFTDVTNPTAYYYDAVYWAYENGITTGTTDLTFSPEQTITRKELVTMLYRLAGEPETLVSDTAFTDIYGTQYDSFRSAILWAESIGLTAGKSSAYTFCPDDKVTRAEIVTFLQRYEVLVAGGTANVSAVSSEFTDVADPDEWYYSAVYWAYENGITEGNSGYAFTFGPNDACTRGEFVTFLYRYAG